MSAVDQIVGRCHVGDSHRKVIRYVISRLSNKHRGFRKMDRITRRFLLRAVIKSHDQNRAVYRDVVSGRF